MVEQSNHSDQEPKGRIERDSYLDLPEEGDSGIDLSNVQACLDHAKTHSLDEMWANYERLALIFSAETIVEDVARDES